MFTDTHCHLEKQYIDNYDQLFYRAHKNGINRIIASGYSVQTNAESIYLSSRYDFIYSTIGYHPDQAEVYNDDDIKILEDQLCLEKVVGIGEIGLDYHYEGYNKDHQKELFIKQLRLAEKYDLPVVIHSREATQDTIDILKQFKLKGVIHSFSGSYETAQIYINMGYKLGINGIITFKNSNLSNTISRLNPDDIVFETDSPYLTPEPFRGQKNESKNIIYIAEKVASIYDISLEKLSEITNKNVKQIFDI